MTLDERVYRGLLRLYSRAFRRRFEAEMLAMFRERRGAATGTLRGRVSFLAAVLVDLGKSVARERVAADPIVEHARAMPLRKFGIRPSPGVAHADARTGAGCLRHGAHGAEHRRDDGGVQRREHGAPPAVSLRPP